MVWLAATIIIIVALLIVAIQLVRNTPEYEEQADGSLKRLIPRNNQANLPE